MNWPIDEPTGSRIANMLLDWLILIPVLLIMVGMSAAIGAFTSGGLIFTVLQHGFGADGLALWLPTVLFGAIGAIVGLYILYLLTIEE